jgi:hypothetical protein
MEGWKIRNVLLKGAGGFGIVLASFFITLGVMDYSSNTSNPTDGERLIKIEEATYGANCGKGVKLGNATLPVAKSCDGRVSCNFLVSVEELGDPAPGCGKDFSVRFTCNQQQPARTPYVKGEANRSTIRVNCEKL